MTDGVLLVGAVAGGLAFAALVLLATQPAIRAVAMKGGLNAFLWPLLFAGCVLVGVAVARHCEEAKRTNEIDP